MSSGEADSALGAHRSPAADELNGPHAAAEGSRRRALLRQAGLLTLSRCTAGRPGTRIALVDGEIGPHRSLEGASISPAALSGSGTGSSSAAAHATFVASILVGRGPDVLGLCPGCTIFSLPAVDDDMLDGTAPHQLTAAGIARAVHIAVEYGCQVIQLGFEVTAMAAP